MKMAENIISDDTDLDANRPYYGPSQWVLQRTDSFVENVQPQSKRVFVVKKTVQDKAKSKINLSQNESVNLLPFDRMFDKDLDELTESRLQDSVVSVETVDYNTNVKDDDFPCCSKTI